MTACLSLLEARPEAGHVFGMSVVICGGKCSAASDGLLLVSYSGVLLGDLAGKSSSVQHPSGSFRRTLQQGGAGACVGATFPVLAGDCGVSCASAAAQVFPQAISATDCTSGRVQCFRNLAFMHPT